MYYIQYFQWCGQNLGNTEYQIKKYNNFVLEFMQGVPSVSMDTSLSNNSLRFIPIFFLLNRIHHDYLWIEMYHLRNFFCWCVTHNLAVSVISNKIIKETNLHFILITIRFWFLYSIFKPKRANLSYLELARHLVLSDRLIYTAVIWNNVTET